MRQPPSGAPVLLQRLHAAIYVSAYSMPAYCCICMCPYVKGDNHQAARLSYYNACMLLYVCPHTPFCILLYVCPHTSKATTAMRRAGPTTTPACCYIYMHAAICVSSCTMPAYCYIYLPIRQRRQPSSGALVLLQRLHAAIC